MSEIGVIDCVKKLPYQKEVEWGVGGRGWEGGGGCEEDVMPDHFTNVSLY
jgi:hypothetical protein